MGSSMLPHALSAVCNKPAIRHPAGQGEAQVHPDVIIEGPVVGGSIRTKRAVSVTYFTRHRTTLPQHLPMFLNLLGGGGAHDVIEPYVPVMPIIGVTGIYDVTFNTTEDEDDIPRGARICHSPGGSLTCLYPAGLLCLVPPFPNSYRLAAPGSTDKLSTNFLWRDNSRKYPVPVRGIWNDHRCWEAP